MTFGAGIGTAAITAGTAVAAVSAATAARAAATTTTAIAFAAAAIITAAFAAMLALALATAGALALGTRGITLLAITAVGATATTAPAAATTAALITVAALAVPFTVRRWGGFGRGWLYAEKTFEPADEAAAGFSFWSRGGQAVTLLGPGIAARFTGLETRTVAPRAAVRIARTGLARARITGSRRRSVQRIEVSGRSGIGVARLAGAGLDAERRAILAPGNGFAGVRFPARGGAF